MLDLGLPDMDGQEVLRELRQWSRVPVIVLSVRASEQEKVRALDLGANDYVTKPFGIQELMARVRALLREQGAGEESPPVFDDGNLRIDLHGGWSRWPESRSISPVRSSPCWRSGAQRRTGHDPAAAPARALGPDHVDDTHYLRIVVGKIRQKLGDDHAHSHYLQTEPGVGLPLVGQRRDVRPQLSISSISILSRACGGNPGCARDELDAFRDRSCALWSSTPWRGIRSTARSSRPAAFDPAT